MNTSSAAANRSKKNLNRFARVLLNTTEVRWLTEDTRREMFLQRGKLIFNATALCPLEDDDRMQVKNAIDRDRLYRDYPSAGNFAITDKHQKYSLSSGANEGRCIPVYLKSGRKVYFCFDYRIKD